LAHDESWENAVSKPSEDGGALRAPQDRGVLRRQAFLAAARDVFVEQGYEAASVNDVVRRAGGSLATLYAQFGNKEGLFLAVAQELHEDLIEAMTPPDDIEAMDLEAGLQTIGEQFCRTVLKREHLGFFRIIVGEGRHFPTQVQRYLATAGAEKVRGVVASFIAAKGVKTDDPELMASYLFELWRSRLHYRALAAEAFTISDEDLAAHVRQAVAFFMRATR